MSKLHIRLLGDFRLVYGDAPITTINTPRLQSLLAYLVLHHERPLARRQLAFLLWPESTEAQAHTNLRKLIHTLRHSLPDADRFLHVDAHTLAWRPDAPFALDVDDFKTALADATVAASPAPMQAALERAVALYQGDLLPDCYEEWVIREREQLRQGLLRALAQLIERLETQGGVWRAIEYAQRLLALDPLDEAVHQTLMRLYAQSGDRVSALRTYETYAAVFRKELGAEPSVAMQQLRARLLAGDMAGMAPGQGSRQGDAPVSEGAAGTSGATPALEPRHNLPLQLTSFIGREQALADVKGLLGRRRLVTLTGSGGSGKTRLALEVGADLAAHQPFEHGVWLVGLADLADPTLVPNTVLTTLNLGQGTAQEPLRLLVEALRPKQMLLILDNCEHVIDAAADLAVTLLRACPQLHILATSREPLNVPGETLWRVPPLPAPPVDSHVTVGSHAAPLADVVRYLMQFEAVCLFVDRATLSLPSFALTSENVGAVAQLCAALDGIPLAIELAAGRVKTMSLPQMVARVNNMLLLLQGGHRTALPRQQTLKGAMDWSYQLLSEAEQRLFRRLAVFAGGFTPAAVEAVCGDADEGTADVLDLLSRLVDKSLVMVGEQAGGVRYRLLEILRQYAQDRLAASGEVEVTQARHSQFYVALAQAANRHLRGADQTRVLRQLETENANLRAALTEAITSGRVEDALRLAGELGQFWWLTGRLQEGRQFCHAALRLADASGALGPAGQVVSGAVSAALAAALGQALFGAAYLDWMADDTAAAWSQFGASLAIYEALADRHHVAEALDALGWIAMCGRDDPTMAHSLIERGLRLREDLGDPQAVGGSLDSLGNLALTEGDYARAHALFQASLRMFKAADDKLGVLGVSGSLTRLEVARGEYAAARPYAEEHVRLERELGLRGRLAGALTWLARIAIAEHDYAQARAALAESVMVRHELQDVRGLPASLEAFAGLLAWQGNARRGAQLLGAAFAARAALHAPRPALEDGPYERNLAHVKAELSLADFERAWAEGQAMTLDEAVDAALVESADDPVGVALA